VPFFVVDLARTAAVTTRSINGFFLTFAWKSLCVGLIFFGSEWAGGHGAGGIAARRF